jgi:hypothetical protein
MERKKEVTDVRKKEDRSASGVDIGLIVMFLKMTPDERLRSNDNAINTIAELRNATSWK